MIFEVCAVMLKKLFAAIVGTAAGIISPKIAKPVDPAAPPVQAKVPAWWTLVVAFVSAVSVLYFGEDLCSAVPLVALR
jgi:hypothetical protein